MDAGAGPHLPEPTSATRSSSRSNEPRNAAQCSRSAACRTFSPHRAQRGPQAPSQTASLQASRPWTAGGSSTGSELASSRWDGAALGLLDDPVPLLGVDHRAVAGLEHPPAAGVEHEQAHVAVVAPVAPAHALAAVGLGVGLAGVRPQQVLPVVDLLERRPGLVGRRGRRARGCRGAGTASTT